MNLCDESDDTQSEYDETNDEMMDSSDNDSITMQEIFRDDIFSTSTTPESNHSTSNFSVQYSINPIHIAVYPGMNGLSMNPVYYTDPQSAAFIADDRNIGNYEEVSSYPSSYSFPAQTTTIPIFSDIQNRGTIPNYNNGLQSFPPSSNYPVSDYVTSTPPFRPPVLANPPVVATNTNLIEPPIGSQQNAATNVETVRKVKRRGRKRLIDSITRTTEVGNLTLEDTIPKKRGRKRKDDNNDNIDGKVQKLSYQSVNDDNMKANIDKNQKKTSKISTINQSANAITETKNNDEEEKKTKKRSRNKTKTITKKQCMEELIQKQKSRMAFPKGTFLIRYCDLETLDCDQIWCVDNHHMLLKYRLSSHIEGKRRLYLKSQPERYVGWKCEEPWHFHELTVLERDRDGSKVLVLYPDAKELVECREKARQQKQIAEEKKRNMMDSSFNTGDTKQNFGNIDAKSMLQNDGTVMDTDEQHLQQQQQQQQQQQDFEVQMINEAANAIERFILVPDNEHSETEEEHMAETIDTVESSIEEQPINGRRQL